MRIIILVLLSLIGLTVSAQSFEGEIKLTKTSGKNISNYRYYVKLPNIRIEEINEKGVLQGYMVMNTKTGIIQAASPANKSWLEVKKNENLGIEGKVECTKTSQTKTIAGIICTLWSVKNTTEKTRINYWVASGFDFFVPHLKLLNRKEKLTSYFVNLPSNQGFLPLESVEYLKIPGVAEHVNEQIKTTKIEAKKITDAKLFVIPKDYTKLTMTSTRK
ncbi:MAG: DUF4412 domain-containing protein [Bacteroidia bacterium]|nr:DUF4412 domain-containing protein [Bacteroidia bacterium]